MQPLILILLVNEHVLKTRLVDLDTNLVPVLVSDSVSDLVSFRDDNSLGFGFGFDKDVLVPDLVPVSVLNWYQFWIWFCPMGFFSTGFGFGFDSDMDCGHGHGPLVHTTLIL